MVTCDRCGRKIKHPVLIRHKESVGLLASTILVQVDEMELCPQCAESFRKWMYMRKINIV